MEYVKINEKYTVAHITYQNENVLKRGEFSDIELNIHSDYYPRYNATFGELYILGIDVNFDLEPIIIKEIHVEKVKERVKKLNEKYGVPKKWKPKINEDYYYVYFGHDENVFSRFNQSYEIDKNFIKKGCAFKTKEEAQYVGEKLLELVPKFRQEYQEMENENEK